MLDKEEDHQLRRVAGQLNWVCNQKRPDISFDSSQASMSLKNAIIEDVLQAKRIVAKLKLQSVTLTFKNIGNIVASEIIAYSDASFANLKNSKSQGGYVFIKSKDGVISPLSQTARKIKRAVESTLAA